MANPITGLKLPAGIVMPNGDTYRPVLMKIMTRDENKIPEDLTLVANNRVLEIVGGEEFIIAYVKQEVLGKS